MWQACSTRGQFPVTRTERPGPARTNNHSRGREPVRSPTAVATLQPSRSCAGAAPGPPSAMEIPLPIRQSRKSEGWNPPEGGLDWVIQQFTASQNRTQVRTGQRARPSAQAREHPSAGRAGPLIAAAPIALASSSACPAGCGFHHWICVSFGVRMIKFVEIKRLA